MDYATVPSLASEILRIFTDCALTLPFDSRHVAEFHGLPNDGYQVPRSGQAKVTSHQTDGPRTKLGYDTCASGVLSSVGDWRWTSETVPPLEVAVAHLQLAVGPHLAVVAPGPAPSWGCNIS